MADIFDRIASATPSKSNNWIQPGGKYVWEIMNLLLHTSDDGTFFIAELLCRQSQATGQLDRSGKPFVPNAVGSSAGFSHNITKHKSAAGNVIDFILSITRAPSISGEQLRQLVSEKDATGKWTRVTPLRGLLISDEAFSKPQKNDKSKDFTHHRWAALDQSKEEVAARRAELDKTNPLV